jgi:hypothetical protein
LLPATSDWSGPRCDEAPSPVGASVLRACWRSLSPPSSLSARASCAQPGGTSSCSFGASGFR